MTLNWISTNKRLIEAVSLINSTPLEFFQHLLEIISTIGIITNEGRTELRKTLNYSEDQLQLLIQSIIHIYKKANLVIMKPMTLQKDLENRLQMHAEKAEAFVKVWTLVTKRDFGDLNKRKKVDSVAWSLNLCTHSSKKLPGMQNIEPKARLQLSMSDFENKNCEATTLELDASGLVELYKTLENIQSKLDSVNNIRS